MVVGDHRGPAHRRGGKGYFLAQASLCVFCSLVGAFYPMLLDWAKTTPEHVVVLSDDGSGAGAIEARSVLTHPFSPLSVVFINQLLQVMLGVSFMMMKRRWRDSWANGALVLKMLPLGLIYALGELVTLRAVQKSSGPVYVATPNACPGCPGAAPPGARAGCSRHKWAASSQPPAAKHDMGWEVKVIANTKLVIAALMSRAVFGRSWSLPWLRWLELLLISTVAALYTLAEKGSMGDQWDWEGAGYALMKSSMVAFSSVFCEHVYKNNPFLVVATLQAAWALAIVAVLMVLSDAGLLGEHLASELRDNSGALSLFGSGPSHPLCASAAHAACVQNLHGGGGLAARATAGQPPACHCVDERGWDAHTLLVIVANISNAVSSALVFKRLNAVTKYICRAASAVPMYLFYCAAGQSSWDPGVFALISLLCALVGHCAWRRSVAAATGGAPREADRDKVWAQQYAGLQHKA